MQHQDSHLTDQDLLLAVDGELPHAREEQVQVHLAACWTCRNRKQEIEGAIGEFVRFHQHTFDAQIPPAAGPRALLRAQIADLAVTQDSDQAWWRTNWWRMAAAASIVALAVLTVTMIARNVSKRMADAVFSQAVPVSAPKPGITPGAAVFLNKDQVCATTNAKNYPVSASLQRKIFEEYGISPAKARAYEVDYLITPALGGAEDIHNLWPQSYSETIWNAHVKDALEDRLHDLVCGGRLDLATAQRDLANDWIGAYKKYFHTDSPAETAR